MKTARLQFIIPVLFFGLLLSAIPFQSVKADTGPKPSLKFVFISRVKPVPVILSGQLILCQDKTCTEPEPLRELGPQRFDCQVAACNAVTYDYSPYYRLEIIFSDGITRQSNTFTKRIYFANYLVTIQQDSLDVVEKSLGPDIPFFQMRAPTLLDLLATLALPLMELILPVILLVLAIRTGRLGAAPASYKNWLKAAWLLAIPAILAGMMWTHGLVTTLIVELLLGAAYLLWKKRPASVILTVILLQNLITQPVLWITVSGLSGIYPIIPLLFAEIVVWLVEADRKSVV
jgi:hypothetical protein